MSFQSFFQYEDVDMVIIIIFIIIVIIISIIISSIVIIISSSSIISVISGSKFKESRLTLHKAQLAFNRRHIYMNMAVIIILIRSAL